MPHIVLLGDSIFDNAAYVQGGADVETHLRRLLPAGWGATLAAVDGAVIDDVPAQLRRVGPEATHLVVSVGGNDALAHADLLDRPSRSSADALGWLADAAGRFDARYRRMLDAVLALRRPTTLCTIYEGNLGPPADRLAAVALAAFNDRILRAAVAAHASAIELRLVCTEPADYANPIEPSVRGGERIARAIVRAVVGRDAAPHAAIFGG